MDGGAPLDLSPRDLMVDGAVLGARGTWVGFGSQAPDRAVEPFATSLEAFAPSQLARGQDLPEAVFGRAETVTWKSTDGRTIEGLLTYPVGYDRASPFS